MVVERDEALAQADIDLNLANDRLTLEEAHHSTEKAALLTRIDELEKELRVRMIFFPVCGKLIGVA